MLDRSLEVRRSRAKLRFVAYLNRIAFTCRNTRFILEDTFDKFAPCNFSTEAEFTKAGLKFMERKPSNFCVNGIRNSPTEKSINLRNRHPNRNTV